MNLKSLYSGDSRDFYLTFTDSDGDAIDITGWKIYFTIKFHYNDTDESAAVKKDITEHTDAINGKTKFSLVNGDTKDLDARTCWYDIQVKKNTGDILTVMSGKIQILRDITRRVD